MTWEPLRHARDQIAEHPDIHAWDMALLETGDGRVVAPVLGHEAASVQDLMQLVRRTPQGQPTRGGWFAAYLPMARADVWVHHSPKSTRVAFRRPGQEPVPARPGDTRLRELPAASLCKRVQAMLDGALVMEDEEALIAKALQAAPGYPPALKLKARLHRVQGDQEAALAVLLDLTGRHRDAEAFYMLADTLDELERPMEALAAYDAALQIRPDYVEVWGDRGMLLKKMDREEEAYASYDRALAIDSGHPGTRLNAAIGHFNAGRLEQAAKHLTMLASKRMDARQEQMAGALATEVMNAGLRGEDWQTTRQFLKAVDWFVHDNPGVLYAWGMCAVKLGDQREARDRLEKAVQLAPTFDDARAALRQLGG